MLEFVEKDFAEKVLASMLAISFILVTLVLFLMRCLSGVDWFLPEILRIIFQTVLVDELSLFR